MIPLLKNLQKMRFHGIQAPKQNIRLLRGHIAFLVQEPIEKFQGGRPIEELRWLAYNLPQQKILEKLDEVLSRHGLEQHEIVMQVAVDEGDIDLRAVGVLFGIVLKSFVDQPFLE